MVCVGTRCDSMARTRNNYRFFHKPYKVRANTPQDQRLGWAVMPRTRNRAFALPDGLRYNNLFGELQIEETYGMSLQSHLAELEKRHRALEVEITDCLAHPAVDDLKIGELKRRKLQVKEEIERLRRNGASVH